MSDINRVLDNLRRQCSRREYCSSDILKKALNALGGDMDKAEAVLRSLVEDKYVDDFRYASAYDREKSGISGWGEVKIRYMLTSKGISRELISDALGEIDHQKAESRLEKLLLNKYRALKDDPQWKIKLLRFALGRGYSYDEINEVLKSL